MMSFVNRFGIRYDLTRRLLTYARHADSFARTARHQAWSPEV